MEPLQVREIRPEEYAEAGAVAARAYQEHAPADGSWSGYLERLADVAARAPRATVLVAVSGGRIVGTATLELTQRLNPQPAVPLAPDEAHLRMLGVDPEHRRRGVASALLAACIDLARTHRKRRLTLDTEQRMAAARAMYEAFGFAFVGTTDRVPGITMLMYERRIDSTVAAQ